METKMIQITAGRGPAECCWVVAKVLKYFMQEGRAKGFTCEVIDREQGLHNGTLFSALVQIKGRNTAAFLNQWLGTIQWVGQSEFRKYHKRKNWFIGVAAVEPDAAFNIDEADFTYQATRSGGPGGQHVNKVNSAVRATHGPTGCSVLVSDSRSQFQNKKLARLRLLEQLKEKARQGAHLKIKNSWQNHNELERGNPVKVFKGSDFKVKKEKETFKTKRQQLKKTVRRMDWEE